MISFVRGPGRLRQRLVAEFVPFCLGLTAAFVVQAFASLLLGGLAGLVVWTLASFVLRGVRRRPTLLFLYRLALVAHVVFWSAQGIEQTAREEGGQATASFASAWSGRGRFLAGYGDAAFALPPQTTLAGWGSRPRRIALPAFGGFGRVGCWCQACMAARGADGEARAPMFRRPDPDVPADVLGARAVVLRPEAGGVPVAIVRLDLVTSDRQLSEAVHGGVADLGYRPEGVIVAATHTHSGPGGFSRMPLSAMLGTDHFDPAVFAAVRDAAVAALRHAHETAVPATIAVVHARDDGDAPLARLRGVQPAGAEIDDRVYGLRLSEREGAQRPIAVLLQYAVHPTLLRRRHMGFSRDIAGAIEDEVSKALSGKPPVLFLNGAVGDVGPSNRHGSGAAATQQLAAAFAARIRPSFEGLRPYERLGVATARRRLDPPTARIVDGVGAREQVLAAVGGKWGEGGASRLAADILALPANALIWSFGVPEVRVGFSWRGALGVGIRADAGVARTPIELGAWDLDFGPPSGDSGEGAGGCTLLWLPGEATAALGRAWRDAALAERGGAAFVVGLANGSIAYLTTEAEYARGGYEAVATIYGPQIGRNAGAALEAARDETRRLRGR